MPVELSESEELARQQRIIQTAADIQAERLSRPLLAYLVQRAAEDSEVAKKALVYCSPMDHKKIVELQLAARRVDDLKAWLDQLLEQARSLLNSQEMESRGDYPDS